MALPSGEGHQRHTPLGQGLKLALNALNGGGSWGGARITGECVPQPEGQFLLTEKVPGPRARMVPGAPQ